MNANSASTARLDTSAMRAARMMRGLEWLMVPIVVVLGFLLASFAVRNSDFWMQLATGRLIAHGQYEFGKDPFSFATGDRYWANHSWLYDYTLYELYHLNEDHPIIVYVKAGLAALLALVMLMAARPHRDQVIVPGAKADPGGWVSAVLVSVGLIAMCSFFALRPLILSILFLAITFWAIDRSREWSARKLCILLGVLFALWANIDAWFILGPAVVLLYLVGEVVQAYLPGGQKTESRRLRQLGLAMVVGLAACLLNPHHVHIFSDVPSELYPNVVAPMENDEVWRSLFMSPSNPTYINHPAFGSSMPGACYASLLVLGAASFVLNFRRIRGPWLLIFVGLTALSMVNWRLIPFFAVVAAPITVLNVRAFFARRPSRIPESKPDVEPDALGSSHSDNIDSQASTVIVGDAGQTSAAFSASQPPREAWWPGAAESAPPATAVPVTTPSVQTRGRELTLTPESMLAFTGVMGRLLTVVLGLFALAAAYPGWLHAAAAQPAHIRRVSWDVVPEAAFVQLAEKLRDWHKDGSIPADARGIVFQLEIPGYIAWYAPGVKTYMDTRFSFLGDLSGDLMVLRKGLSDWKNNVENAEDWPSVLRRRGITYLIISKDRSSGELQLVSMLASDQQWPLWFQNGYTAVFGWYDPSAPPKKDLLKLDLLRLAFGSSALRVPSVGSLAADGEPSRQVGERTIFDRFLEPPMSPVSPETEAASIYLTLQGIRRDRAAIEADNTIHVAHVLAHQLENRMLFRSLNIEGLRMLSTNMAVIDPIFIAAGFLALREARIGTQNHPRDGFPYLILGISYGSLHSIGKIKVQEQASAFHQALDRLTPDQIEGNRFIASLAMQAWMTLAELHRQQPMIDPNSRQQIYPADLAEECYLKALDLFDRHPPAGMSEEERERERNKILRPLEALQRNLLPVKDKFTTDLERSKQNNEPITKQLDLALRNGLAREALKLLEDSTDVADLATINWFVQLYLAVGRVQDAQNVLTKAYEIAPDMHAKLSAVQLSVWVAAGEYALAGKGTEETIKMIESMEKPREDALDVAKAIAQLHFSVLEPNALPLSAYTLLVCYDQATQKQSFQMVQKASMLGFRAILALEEGDIPTARKFLQQSLAVGIPEPDVALFLNLLDQAAEKETTAK
jgi:hypothetical protein